MWSKSNLLDRAFKIICIGEVTKSLIALSWFAKTNMPTEEAMELQILAFFSQ